MNTKVIQFNQDDSVNMSGAGYIYLLSDPKHVNYYKLCYTQHLTDIKESILERSKKDDANYELQYYRVAYQAQYTTSLIHRRLFKYLVKNNSDKPQGFYHFDNIYTGIDNINHIVDCSNYLYMFSDPASNFMDFIADTSSKNKTGGRPLSKKVPLFLHTIDSRIDIAFDYINNNTDPQDPEYGVQTILKFILTATKDSPLAQKAGEAAYKLADVFKSSQFVPENKEDVLFCYKKASEFGNKDATKALMEMYYHGNKEFNIEQDYQQAFIFLSILSTEIKERIQLAYLFSNGRQFLLKQDLERALELCAYNDTNKRLWDLDIIKAKIIASKPWPKFGNKRILNANNEKDQLIIHDYEGMHPYQILMNIPEADNFNENDICEGHVEVKYILGLYLLGECKDLLCEYIKSNKGYVLKEITKDIDLATTYLTESAKAGHPLACLKMASLLEQGSVIPKNDKESIQFKTRALDCQYNIDTTIPFPIFGLRLF